jgi:hypothetical protein
MRSLGSSDLALEVIIATSLVALYLYSCGRLLEGKYHADAAASLTLASNLHQLPPIGISSSFSPPNAASQADKHRIFWNTFELGCWTIITGSYNPFLSEDPPKAIKTAWPNEVSHTRFIPALLWIRATRIDEYVLSSVTGVAFMRGPPFTRYSHATGRIELGNKSESHGVIAVVREALLFT